MNAEQIKDREVGADYIMPDPAPSDAKRTSDAGAAIDRFQAFMREHPIPAGAIDVEALIEEGRS